MTSVDEEASSILPSRYYLVLESFLRLASDRARSEDVRQIVKWLVRKTKLSHPTVIKAVSRQNPLNHPTVTKLATALGSPLNLIAEARDGQRLFSLRVLTKYVNHRLPQGALRGLVLALLRSMGNATRYVHWTNGIHDPERRYRCGFHEVKWQEKPCWGLYSVAFEAPILDAILSYTKKWGVFDVTIDYGLIYARGEDVWSVETFIDREMHRRRNPVSLVVRFMHWLDPHPDSFLIRSSTPTTVKLLATVEQNAGDAMLEDPGNGIVGFKRWGAHEYTETRPWDRLRP